MSLEQAIHENTAAVKALIEVWGMLVTQGNAVVQTAAGKAAQGESYVVTAGGTPVITVQVADPKPQTATKPQKPVAAPAPTPPATEQVQTTEAAASETATESPSDEVVDLALLTKETTAAATRNRAGLVALLAEFKATRASAIPEAQWVDYVAKVRLI